MPDASESRVVFTPSGLNGVVPVGTTVLDAARRLGADLDTVCGGRGICGRCQVSAPTGTFAKWGITNDGRALSAPGALEHDYRGNRPLVAGQRLGCAARIVGAFTLPVTTMVWLMVSSAAVAGPTVSLAASDVPA